jgi:K+ transporter
MFIIATLTAIVASQCLISACFSLVKQSVALDLFPKVQLIHTSENHEGQIYSPEVNYFLMLICVVVVLGLRSVDALGHAYGTCYNVLLHLVFFFLGFWNDERFHQYTSVMVCCVVY